jgi:hypothetical protein
MPFHTKTALLLGFNVAGKDKPYLGCHIEWLMFSPDFMQFWIFSTDFLENLQYQFSLKPAQRQSR